MFENVCFRCLVVFNFQTPLRAQMVNWWVQILVLRRHVKELWRQKNSWFSTLALNFQFPTDLTQSNSTQHFNAFRPNKMNHNKSCPGYQFLWELRPFFLKFPLKNSSMVWQKKFSTLFWVDWGLGICGTSLKNVQLDICVPSNQSWRFLCVSFFLVFVSLFFLTKQASVWQEPVDFRFAGGSLFLFIKMWTLMCRVNTPQFEITAE